MTSDFLPFSKPVISEADIEAVAEVLRSGWITTGPKNVEFEKRFCEYTGAAGAVAVSSATGGMHILLHALGIGPGDEVITPAMTWVSTANLIALSGAVPVFVDVDRDTLLVSPESVAQALTERTKAVIPVHFAGVPVDIAAVEEAAGAVPVIYDAAHALGTHYRGRHINTHAPAIYSFHPIKNITTGEGGMITAGDAELLQRLRSLKFHGLGVDAYDRQMQGRAPQAQVVEPAYKYNLTDIAAALGSSQLTRSEDFIEQRRALAELYLELLGGVDELAPLALPRYPFRHAWNLMVVRVLDGARVKRDEFMQAMKSRGIGTGLHFRAIHLQKYYREALGTAPGMLPNTEWNSDRICSLPLLPGMQPEDVRRVVTAAKEVLKGGMR